MKTIDAIKAGAFGVHFTLRRLIGISCFLALLAFPGGSFAASRMANVSTRANVGTGSNNVILGTIIVGSGSATLVFRGIGPSMAPYFPAGTTLANPNLEIKNANGATIGANNNWQDDPGQAAAIQAAGLAPSNGLESAYRIVLGPGAYSAVLSGVSGGTGIGLVEVYDITSQPSSIKLANISTRANAGTGNNEEVFGVIIQGGNKSLGLRGIGPSLAQYFSGTLANPALSLRTSGGSQLQYNQNWKDYQQNLISAYGLAPSQDLESAMITGNLNGSYTVVMDTSGGSGIASIEAYDLGEQTAVGGGSGTIYCAPYPNSILAESGSFNLPAGTPLTLRFGGHASHVGQGCPQCSQPGGPGCSGSSWSIDAVLVDNSNTVIGAFPQGVGGFDQCNVHSVTTARSIPFGFTPPYRLRLRATSSTFCPPGTGIYADYYILNAP
ncbi:MAG TPA: hypothetical protein VEX43_06470 [Chthoniobacterales bacterium]|nr:hypothetical protein [Chthoniobacterales bacterium]